MHGLANLYGSFGTDLHEDRNVRTTRELMMNGLANLQEQHKVCCRFAYCLRVASGSEAGVNAQVI